jgi:hypothetical protein
MRGHADRCLDRRQCLHGVRERRLREVDQVRVDPGEIDVRQERRELLAVAAAELDHAAARSQRPADRRPVSAEQLHLGARDPVPRKVADRVEQRRAERVVEESRGELSRALLEVAADVPREGVPLVRIGEVPGRRLHGRLLAHRKAA